MPSKSQDRAQVVCPHCGHPQSEPRRAVSSRCRQCGQYLSIQELLHPHRTQPAAKIELRQIKCFDCAADLTVPPTAKSAMCKRCSSYVDLQDYAINNAVSRNFKTKGKFVVQGKGYIFNTEVVAREIIIQGQVIGKLVAEESLTIYSGAEIKGSLKTPLLVIPADNSFRWKEPLRVGAAEISGEWVGDLHADTRVLLRASGRLFGNVRARNLVVEEGALLVGKANVGVENGNSEPKPV